MRGMKEFYPKEYEEFFEMAEKQGVEIPTLKKYIKEIDENILEKLYNATIIHEKPLSNALGDNFKNILTKEKVREIFLKMIGE
jgi:3-deoxy-alpha-D-manno-octulosonate 8-oxidase